MTKDSEAKKSSTSISPYFLSTSDKLGNKVIQVVLTGENYDEWFVKFCGALRARKKTGFIDGTIKKSDDKSEEIEDWYMVNAMVVNWIFNVTEPALGSTISYVDEAKILWDDIEQRFSVGNGPKLHHVKGSISACKQGEKELVSEYYGRQKRLWDELNKYDRNPTFQEEGVRGFGIETGSGSRGENRSEPIGFVAKTAHNVNNTPRFEGGNRSTAETNGEITRPRCDKCNRWDHVREKCFDIIGYPKGWRERGKTGSSYGGSRGGDRGRGGGYGRGGANHVHGSGEATETKEQYVSVPKEQWDAYVNNAKGSSSSSTNNRMTGKINITLLWLLDSGATHHMTGSCELLSDIHKIAPCMVTLPNGKMSKATKEGKVALGGSLVLNNVLFVPDFNCNLISVYQLSIDLDYNIQFTNSSCVIQDRVSKMTIDTGEQHGRLYLLKGLRKQACGVLKTKDEAGVWHRRLGHPSRRVVQYLPFISSKNINHNTELCDICFRAKQTREKFIASDNKAVKIFELIHCDLWGDYRTPSFCGSRFFLTIVDDYSRAVWVYLVKTKYEESQLLKNFVAMVRRQFDVDVKIVRTDNGTEFTCLKDFFLLRKEYCTKPRVWVADLLTKALGVRQFEYLCSKLGIIDPHAPI
ncbi:uncharacterized protein LOC141618136 [Silene latifolia]|uniref:uncharacterized protein LOC141618136 n=1 Tax=Silene latifolia TaxID=37657 RepID=UPI003D76BCB4